MFVGFFLSRSSKVRRFYPFISRDNSRLSLLYVVLINGLVCDVPWHAGDGAI